MKTWFGSVGLLMLLCLTVPRSEASEGPIVFSAEANLGGNFFVETFTLANLQSTSNSGINVIKVRFDFPVTAIVLSVPSGWNSVSSGTSIEVFSTFPGQPPFGTDLAAGGSLSAFKVFVNQSLGSIAVTYTLVTPLHAVLVTTGTSTVSEIFSQFTGQLEISKGGVNPAFELNAHFTLGQNSDGIDPVTELLILQVGPLSKTIPAGSFAINKHGSFVFEGVIDGAKLEIKIKPLGNNTFTLAAEGNAANLTGLSGPLPIGLTIGNDAGATTVSAEQSEDAWRDRL